MSKADKMFEELGYKLNHCHYSCNDTDVYTYHEKNSHNFLRFKTSNRTFFSMFDKVFDVKELQAIYEKCKELGWLE